MEINTIERTKDLKPHKFNVALFEMLKGSDYESLKKDIAKSGVKVELHVLPDKTVICGHQRLRIAKELGIEHLRCKIVDGLDTEDKIKEYIIVDNLLRRQLTPEKRAFLLDELSRVYEKGRGYRTDLKEPQVMTTSSYNDVDKKPQEEDKAGNNIELKKPIKDSVGKKEDVNIKTAKIANVSPKTVQRARAYVKVVKKDPKKYTKRNGTLQNISTVLKKVSDEKKKRDTKPLPEGKFNVILADPPWKYNERADGEKTKFGGGAGGHYPLMSLEEIKQCIGKDGKSIKDIIADSAVLFLWTTFPRFKEALEVMESWGFKYITAGFVWTKLNPKNNKPFFGVGYYTKSNHEPCLLGRRGEAMKPFTDTVSSAILSPRREHSRKPDEAKERIKQMYPKASAIELFAKHYPDEKSEETDQYWKQWGDEC